MKSLELAFTHIDNALISGDQKECIRQFATRYPAAATNYFGFETVLADSRPVADFAFNLSNTGCQWLAGNGMHPRLSALCKIWGESTTQPFSDGHNVWLEYDTSTNTDIHTEPSVFLAIDDVKDILGTHSRSLDQLSETVLPIAIPAAAVPLITEQLRHILALLPEPVQKIQLGFMLARQVPGARLCLFHFTASLVVPFLKMIGWGGNYESVTHLVDRYASYSDSLCLHLDIAGPTLYPTLGIELIHEGTHPWDWQPEFTDHWEHIFNLLQEDALCTPDKAKQLLGFPQREAITVPLIDRLASQFRNQDGQLQDVCNNGVLTLGLQHIKFKIDAAGTVIAKGYFGGQYEETNNSITPANAIADDACYA